MMAYEPRTDFERAVFERLAEIEAIARRSENAATAAFNATTSLHEEVLGLRSDTHVFVDAAMGARSTAIAAENRVISAEERIELLERERPTDRPTPVDAHRTSAPPEPNA